MCTASWSFGSDRTILSFSRDERKSRSRATPPAVKTVGQTHCIAPQDSEAYGTWILANDRGLCVFLLNNYGAGVNHRTGRVFESRGKLPWLFADCPDVGEAARRLAREFDPQSWQPFHLCFLDLRSACCMSWDGRALSETDVSAGFLTTSSYRTAEVEAYRRQRYDALLPGRGDDREAWHVAYHQDLAHSDSAFNPFMLRPESETHCLSVIVMDSDSLRFDYFERVTGQPVWRPRQRVELPLAR